MLITVNCTETPEGEKRLKKKKKSQAVLIQFLHFSTESKPPNFVLKFDLCYSFPKKANFELKLFYLRICMFSFKIAG